MTHAAFPGWFERVMFQSLHLVAGRQTLRFQWAKDAYGLWQEGVTPRPCSYNFPSNHTELPCPCQGCFQRRCLDFFDQALVQLNEIHLMERK